jgi:hypothetical protein
MRTGIRSVVRVGLAGVVLASLGSSSLAAAMSSPSTSPTVTIARTWGWAVVRQPQTASYPLSNTDGRDSAGATPTYQRESVGHSTITFPGISNGYIGVPVVTALAKGNRQCAIVDWVSTTAPGHSITFGLSIQNDGNSGDRFKVKATGTGVSGYAVKYFRGTTDITAAIIAGTYRTPFLAPAATYGITARVTVKSGAAAGSSVARLVTVTSVANSTKKDAVKFIGKRA